MQVPGITLTCLSFAALWMDSTNCGERLSLVATMLLGIQLLMIIVADKLPTCAQPPYASHSVSATIRLTQSTHTLHVTVAALCTAPHPSTATQVR